MTAPITSADRVAAIKKLLDQLAGDGGTWSYDSWRAGADWMAKAEWARQGKRGGRVVATDETSADTERALLGALRERAGGAP